MPPKEITLKHDAKCGCGAQLPAGSKASWAKGEKPKCLKCAGGAKPIGPGQKVVSITGPGGQSKPVPPAPVYGMDQILLTAILTPAPVGPDRVLEARKIAAQLMGRG